MILTVIVPLVLIIGVGFFIGKIKKIDINPFVDFLLYVTVPALMITSLVENSTKLSNIAVMFTSGIFVMLGLWILVVLFFKLFNCRSDGLKLSMAFGNTGNLGLPVALFAFGSVGLAQALVYDMSTAFLIYTVGIYAVSKKDSLKEVFRMPQIYAIIISVLLVYFAIPIPDFIFTPLDLIGKITIPLALIILGYKLTEVKVTSIKFGLLSSAVRIGGGLLLASIFVFLFNIQGITRSVILMQSAMPSALMSMILAQKYHSDPEKAASAVFISTIISLVTIPILLYFIM